MSDLRLGSDVSPTNQIPGILAGEDITPGFVALNGSGEVVMANAGEAYSQTGPTIGFAPHAADDGAAVCVVREGMVFEASGLTAGEAVYLSGSADGGVQGTAPATTNDLQQIVGQAITSTTFMIQIDPIYDLSA